MFASMTAAYDGLSDRMQQYISGLYAIHDMKPFRPLFGKVAGGPQEAAGLRAEISAAAASGGAHPSGLRDARSLFVNPQFTLAIDGMEERESRALLDTLFQQALVPEYQFRHHWQPHTIAMWDNRSTQHYAVHDYYPQRRYMERVTIKGGPVTGARSAPIPPSIKRAKYVAPKGVDTHGGHKPH